MKQQLLLTLISTSTLIAETKYDTDIQAGTEWWVYILFSLIFLGIIFGLVSYYSNRKILKHKLILEHEYSKKQQEISHIEAQFFAVISDEFSIPLRNITAQAEQVLSAKPDPDLYTRILNVRQNALHMQKVINQFLDISKLDEGILQLNISKQDLVNFIKNIVLSFEPLADRKDIALSVVSDKNEIDVYLDKSKMEKVLINILSNALKFTPTGGEIIVSITTSNDYAVIKVKDNGIGIPQAELPKVFERFYHVEDSSNEYHSTGMGLPEAKELIQLHHGRIYVDSVEGKWSEFTIEIPLGRAHFTVDEIIEINDDTDSERDSGVKEPLKAFSHSVSSLTRDISPATGEDKTLIFIVEDNKDVRRYIKDSLEKNFLFEEAANGEGLKKAKSYRLSIRKQE